MKCNVGKIDKMIRFGAGIAIIFAGAWGYIFWQETPDHYSLIGFSLILAGILFCSPLFQQRKKT